MGTRIVQCVIFILLGLFPCSGLCGREVRSEAIGEKREIAVVVVVARHEEEEEEKQLCCSISTTQNDITTPIPTVPTMNMNPNPNPSTPNTTPTAVVNPAVSNPDSPPGAGGGATTNPVMTTPTTSTSSSSSSSSTTTSSSSSSSSSSWCVAIESAPQIALQVALDYACGYGGADCSPIQPGGSCYDPNMLRHHASYAFNTYYQNNPLPTSCNFAGTAIITNTDPSYETCQYPSTSTSSSVLNTTNSSGSTVFGAGPSNPTSAEAAVSSSLPNLFISTCLMMLLY